MLPHEKLLQHLEDAFSEASIFMEEQAGCQNTLGREGWNAGLMLYDKGEVMEFLKVLVTKTITFAMASQTAGRSKGFQWGWRCRPNWPTSIAVPSNGISCWPASAQMKRPSDGSMIF